jgi:hypothetical protein
LATPSGGPLLTKRLAYIGASDGYLMYAARWFPFHNYAADRRHRSVLISLPLFKLPVYVSRRVANAGGNIALSATAESRRQLRLRKIHKQKSASRRIRIAVHTKVGDDALIAAYGETLVGALEYTRNNTASRRAESD